MNRDSAVGQPQPSTSTRAHSRRHTSVESNRNADRYQRISNDSSALNRILSESYAMPSSDPHFLRMLRTLSTAAEQRADATSDANARGRASSARTLAVDGDWMLVEALANAADPSNRYNRRANAHSRRAHDRQGRDRRCCFCRRLIPHDEFNLHYTMCLTRPRVTYNEDRLTIDKGECAICLEEMNTGDVIARLPCLCIYHKACIDLWFQQRQTCPEHPGD